MNSSQIIIIIAIGILICWLWRCFSTINDTYKIKNFLFNIIITMIPRSVRQSIYNQFVWEIIDVVWDQQEYLQWGTLKITKQWLGFKSIGIKFTNIISTIDYDIQTEIEKSLNIAMTKLEDDQQAEKQYWKLLTHKATSTVVYTTEVKTEKIGPLKH